MSYEKKSSLLPAAIGAGIGALRSEEGERGRGALHGAGTGIGTDLGGFGGMAAGGALGSLIAPGPGTLAGAAAGLPIGMYGGFKGTNALQRKLMDGPLPYDSDHKSKKDKSKKPKDGDGDGKVNDGTSEEKEASIQSIVNAGKAGLSQLGQKIKLPAAGMAGLGLGGLAGNEVGKRTGERIGDAAGYARGSDEGGNQAMQDLFNGLIDMRRRGSKMKSKDMPFIHTGTNPYGPGAERAALESLYKESSSCNSSHRAKKKKKKVKEVAEKQANIKAIMQAVKGLAGKATKSSPLPTGSIRLTKTKFDRSLRPDPMPANLRPSASSATGVRRHFADEVTPLHKLPLPDGVTPMEATRHTVTRPDPRKAFIDRGLRLKEGSANAALEIATKVAAYRRIQEKQAREVRIKLASHVLRMHHLRQELETYDPYQLSKSAAIGAHKDDRMKAAALVRQIELEKQAVIGGIVGGLLGGGARAAGGMLAGGAKQALKSGIKGVGQGAKAGFGVDKAVARTALKAAPAAFNVARRGVDSAANMAGRGIGGAARGMMQGAKGGGGMAGAARGAIGGGAKGVARGIKTDPLAGTALLGGGAMAAGAGLQNAMKEPMQQGQQMLAQGQQQANQAIAQAPQAMGNYFSNLSNAFMGRGPATGMAG